MKKRYLTTCALCSKYAKKHKFIYNDNFLCTSHYAEFLEYLIISMGKEVDFDSMQDAYSALSISMDLKPTPTIVLVPEPEKEEKVNSHHRPLSMGM